MAVSADMNLTVGNHYTFCQSKLKNIGTAMEAYYTDNKSYPETLDCLKPKYLQKVPQCYEGGGEISQKAAEHYRTHYGVTVNTYEYNVSSDRSAYTIVCRGLNHPSVGVDAGYPQYNSKDGLIPR
jgi:hypothetical protein